MFKNHTDVYNVCVCLYVEYELVSFGSERHMHAWS